MSTDWDRRAVANAVLEQQGGSALLFVAARSAALAPDGDEVGVANWKKIAQRMTRLAAPPPKKRNA